jgi:hypothetical protein
MRGRSHEDGVVHVSGQKADTARSVDVNHAPSSKVAKGASRLLFDIRPGRIGNRGKLAMKIIHTGFSPLREPTPSEPSSAGAVDGAGSSVDPAAGIAAAAAVSFTDSRNVADGTKNRGSGHRAAEVEQPIIIAGRATDEHVLGHICSVTRGVRQ